MKSFVADNVNAFWFSFALETQCQFAALRGKLVRAVRGSLLNNHDARRGCDAFPFLESQPGARSQTLMLAPFTPSHRQPSRVSSNATVGLLELHRAPDDLTDCSRVQQHPTSRARGAALRAMSG